MTSYCGRKPLKNAISFCRFCRKQIVSSQLGKSATPRADLFKPLTNKELTTQIGVTEVVLSDIVNELARPSEKISGDDSLSNRSRLACARSLVRSYAVIRKLLKSINLGLELKSCSQDQISSGVKRKSSGSPGSPSVKVMPKKTKDLTPDLLLAAAERTEYSSARRNILKDLDGATVSNESEKENEEPFMILTSQEEVPNGNSGERMYRDMNARVNESKLAGVTKIIVCSPGGKCIVHVQFQFQFHIF